MVDFPHPDGPMIAVTRRGTTVDQRTVVSTLGEISVVAKAAKQAGLSEVPVVLRDVDDRSVIAMALIENIQREDLNPLEEAVALSRLIDEFSLTHQNAAEAVGRSRAAVSNLLRLLELPEERLEAIREVYSGGAPMSRQIARRVVQFFQEMKQMPTITSAQRSPEIAMLTEREEQVLQFLSRGYSYVELAKEMGVTVNTIQTHIRGLYAKLEVHSKSQAIFQARQRGILES